MPLNSSMQSSDAMGAHNLREKSETTSNGFFVWFWELFFMWIVLFLGKVRGAIYRYDRQLWHMRGGIFVDIDYSYTTCTHRQIDFTYKWSHHRLRRQLRSFGPGYCCCCRPYFDINRVTYSLHLPFAALLVAWDANLIKLSCFWETREVGLRHWHGKKLKLNGNWKQGKKEKRSEH